MVTESTCSKGSKVLVFTLYNCNLYYSFIMTNFTMKQSYDFSEVLNNVDVCENTGLNSFKFV